MDLNYMFQLCGNMKTTMMDLSRDRFSRASRSSSKGAQANPEATESDSDEDDGAPATQKGRHFFMLMHDFLFFYFLFIFLFFCFHSRTILFYYSQTFVCIASKTLVPLVWHFYLLTSDYNFLHLFDLV